MVPTTPSPADSNDSFAFSCSPDEDDQPAMALVEAVAWVRDVPVLELEPLHYSIDIDELNGLFGDRRAASILYRSSSEPSPDDPSVAFRYEGCDITVTDEEIRSERA